MSQEVLKNLEELAASIEENTPHVREKIADEAVVISASKYHSALERLAQE